MDYGLWMTTWSSLLIDVLGEMLTCSNSPQRVSNVFLQRKKMLVSCPSGAPWPLVSTHRAGSECSEDPKLTKASIPKPVSKSATSCCARKENEREVSLEKK